MLKLKADGWTGEGDRHVALLYAFPPDLYDTYNSPTDLVGERVEIDGTVYWVTDIERQNIGGPNDTFFRIKIKES